MHGRKKEPKTEPEIANSSNDSSLAPHLDPDDWGDLERSVVEAFLEDDPEAACSCCRRHLSALGECDDAYGSSGRILCEECTAPLLKVWREQARTIALTECVLTSDLPTYDPDLEFKPTPEEYEAGARMAYTPNAFYACLRHGCTNYDDLIRDLDGRTYVWHAILYDEIRDRVDELVVPALPR